jgi:hypothetical protein
MRADREQNLTSRDPSYHPGRPVVVPACLEHSSPTQPQLAVSLPEDLQQTPRLKQPRCDYANLYQRPGLQRPANRAHDVFVMAWGDGSEDRLISYVKANQGSVSVVKGPGKTPGAVRRLR